MVVFESGDVVFSDWDPGMGVVFDVSCSLLWALISIAMSSTQLSVSGGCISVDL